MDNLKPRFSICIPVWEQHGSGLTFLNVLLNSILTQTFTDYEIIISDHSKNDEISDYILGVIHHGFFQNLRYFRYKKDYGNGVSNLNNTLKQANGDIIKIMFQDDIMYSKDCLRIIDYSFNENVSWLVNGCNHTRDGINFERDMSPSWNDELHLGVNTISSPSVLSFRNSDIELFDEKLTMLMDVEYYYRLYNRFGLPKFLNDILISNRCHENQISSRYKGDVSIEIEYIKNKYNV